MIKISYQVWIVLLATILFFGTNFFFEGSIKNRELLAKELQATPETVSEWNLKEKPPFNYRLLFPAIINGTSSILPTTNDENQKFYILYSFYSLLFFVGAALSTYQLVNYIFSSPKIALFGTLLFLISPPIFFAYTLPVHTREDMLGYIFLSLGLLAILKKNYIGLIITFLFGVLTRETLLILPFLYFFYTHDNKYIKVLFTALPIMIFIFIRWYLGGEYYDTWLGLKWNLSNPFQVIIFLFLTFHLMWIPFFIVLRKGINTNQAKPPLIFIKKTALITFFLVLSTTFLFGIFNEIRLMFLLYPWVIILCLNYFLDKNELIQQYLKSNQFYILLVMLILSSVFIIPNLTDRILTSLGTSKHNTPYLLWILSTYIYGAVAIIMLAFTFFNHERKH